MEGEVGAAISVPNRRTAIELRSSSAVRRGRPRRTSSCIGFLISTELCKKLFKKPHPICASG